jgi:glycosyltransferase involved in cell wall biosynthesis
MQGPVSVIIPAYNERATLPEVLRRVLASPLVGEAVVIDDGSTDGSRNVLCTLRDPRVLVLFHPENRGKGAAVRRGFALVSRPVTIIQDADLELDPDDYPAVVEPILRNEADVVYGSRFLGRGCRSIHTLGNRGLTLWSNLFTGMHLSDVHTCYKAIRSSLIPRLRLTRDRFDFDPEVTIQIARLGVRVREVVIRYTRRTDGKKIGWRDGVEALATTVRTALFRS